VLVELAGDGDDLLPGKTARRVDEGFLLLGEGRSYAMGALL